MHSPLWKTGFGRLGSAEKERTRYGGGFVASGGIQSLRSIDSSRVREGSDLLSKVIKEDANKHLVMDDLEKAFKAPHSATKCSFQQPG